MKKIIALTVSLLIIVAVVLTTSLVDNEFTWQLPQDTPAPPVPADNPMNKAKVELGRHLFYDKRLSINNSTSCASCHLQSKAFTDGKKLSSGAHGDLTPRNAMSLTNVGYNPNFTWANPLMTQLEHQARVPLFGDNPIEMGLAGREKQTLATLSAEPIYQQLFPQAFSQSISQGIKEDEQSPINFVNIIKAISAFERTLISFNSPYDQYLRGENVDTKEDSKFGESEKRGMDIFFSEQGECFHCHGGFNFTDSSVHENAPSAPNRFHNNGLYNVDGLGGYPKSDRGLFDMTSSKTDMGKFKAPTLRNIALTGPYMHDGSLETLESVVDHYVAGGTNIHSGPNKGFGVISPLKSEFVPGLDISPQQRADLLHFLHSLTDNEFINNPALSDPWK